jgi:predicted thioesterase
MMAVKWLIVIQKWFLAYWNDSRIEQQYEWKPGECGAIVQKIRRAVRGDRLDGRQRTGKVAELEDVEIAIKIFTWQLVIRITQFTTEVPDRIGYYYGLIKTITAKMERQLKAGVASGLVAKSRRDYEKETHAHRDNETHIFERAWNVYATTWLTKITVQKANGQTYQKYLPVSGTANRLLKPC